MNSEWRDFLRASGAVFEDERLAHFGDPRGERGAARGGAILADLSHLEVIRFSGDDSENFLQGQLSCDVRQAKREHASIGSYCTPKGRMLATFLLWREADGFCMQLPADVRAGVQKRLGMYVLRAKVRVSDGSADTVRLGISGSAAEVALAELGGVAPQADYDLASFGNLRAIRLPGGRFELLVPSGAAADTWQSLSRYCMPAGSSCWEWLDIQAGIPMVTARTQEQFVPQMANLEIIGGVSFQKGCYPGQEIVARTHYLGKVKRRMHLAHIDTDSVPQAGDELFGNAPAGQSTGMIVNAQPAPQGGYDALAVILGSSLEAGEVRWGRADGPALRVRALPYEVN